MGSMLSMLISLTRSKSHHQQKIHHLDVQQHSLSNQLCQYLTKERGKKSFKFDVWAFNYANINDYSENMYNTEKKLNE